jgi:BirA family biotin operon repressor/biotin-[acetyl-CoA-carboxylase] ligase
VAFYLEPSIKASKLSKFYQMKNWTHKNFTIHQFEQLESTNKTAFELANSRNLFDYEIVLTNSQTAGKGRESRVWSSPKGNLYFSLILQPKISLEKIAQISFVAITALRLMVEGLKTNQEIQNKWPNDLLINEKKIAGLLLESKLSQKNCEFVVLGIGLNLVSNPNQTIFPAGNLKDFGVNLTAEEALKKFLNEFEKIYNNWTVYGFLGVRKLWLQKAYRLGEKISVKNGEEQISGIFVDLDEEGNLILNTENGVKKILAADVYSVIS